MKYTYLEDAYRLDKYMYKIIYRQKFRKGCFS